jgi:hypothetical protein
VPLHQAELDSSKTSCLGDSRATVTQTRWPTRPL